jgi:hypothetical protein
MKTMPLDALEPFWLEKPTAVEAESSYVPAPAFEGTTLT